MQDYRVWIDWFARKAKRFASLWVTKFLLFTNVAVVMLDIAWDDVQLSNQAYVGIFALSLFIGIVESERQPKNQRPAEAAKPAPTPIGSGGSRSRQRVGIDVQGGRVRLRDTNISNHDTGIKSRDADINSDDLDIR